ncbi:TIGR02281 family clan AA aspartic protease [Bosea caraganae]|uniref:TIGR02281 family clan AA aspartic protease n=1 Tax=Bosea caraganae TaxID=2763117 RepID=A0A370L906_9HYPH|nr:TIGR02281 family clan AA aspartic protease [Bosea caraganae]RDJ26874.1 TIGR02281 family clan AA aspartic protease [Bosea caraganae]RDJ30761.1 TIGR02281 family clan AA aspartic protease [Bosea caraganae]
MAQRPIVWAVGVAFAVGYAAMSSSARLADLFAGETSEAPAMQVAEAAPAGQPQQPPARPTLTVAADYRGHFVVHPTIENYRVKMLVDTGASVVALTEDDARALGIRPAASEYNMSLRTANGVVRGARVNLREVRLGSILVRNVEAVVLPAGALSMSLLGTSFLAKLQGYEVQTGRMILRG